MSDYSIAIKVRNGRIRRKIAECGFSSVGELCRKSGLSPSGISALINLKVPPLTGAGHWRQSAVDLAEVLGCTCEELFSETQRTLALRDNQGECFITEARMLKLSGRFEEPLRENPGEQLLEDADEQAKAEVIRRALNQLNVTPRDRRITESHFGIGCEERTLSELALEFGVSEERVRNCLTRALCRLRFDDSATRRSLLQAYQPADAMSTADEARIRGVQKRAAMPPTERRVEIRAKEGYCAAVSTSGELTRAADGGNRPAGGARICAPEYLR
jgi:RNA polymerase sigma factor (sigma-70 family)